MAGTRTIAAALPRRPNRIQRSAQLGLLGGGVLILEVVLAAGLVDARFSRLLLLFGAGIAMVAVFRLPLAASLAMIALTDFIFYATYFSAPVGPVEARPFEFLLGGLLLVALIRPVRRSWGGATGIALALFLLILAVSALLAVTSGRATVSDALSWGRPFALLTFFYVVVRLFPAAEDRRNLLLGASVVAALTGVVALLVSLGWDLGDALKGEGSQIVREEEGLGGVQRVRLPGLSLGYALFWYAAVQLLGSRGLPRWGWAAISAGIAADVLVSFNRNMWLGIAAGLLLLIIVGGPALRGRFVLAIAVIAAGLSVVTLAGGSEEGRLLEPLVQRASTILNPGEVTRESSLRDRGAETSTAWRVASDNALLGVGAGAPFGLYTSEMIGPDSYVKTPQLFLHNQYLYLLLVGGIGGLVSFIAFLVIPLIAALRRHPRDVSVTACGVGIAMIMMSAVVAIYFSVEDMTVVLALLTGVIIADGEERSGSAAVDASR